MSKIRRVSIFTNGEPQESVGLVVTFYRGNPRSLNYKRYHNLTPASADRIEHIFGFGVYACNRTELTDHTCYLYSDHICLLWSNPNPTLIQP